MHVLADGDLLGVKAVLIGTSEVGAAPEDTINRFGTVIAFGAMRVPKTVRARICTAHLLVRTPKYAYTRLHDRTQTCCFAQCR